MIGALRVEHDALVLTVQGDITNLSRHVAHPGIFGRHQMSDIDGYTGKYSSYNGQGIITDLDTRIDNHITDPIDAHDASAISFDDSGTFISANEVQTAIEELDKIGITTIRIHQDDQHSNSILSSQEVFYDDDHSYVVVSSNVLNIGSKLFFCSTLKVGIFFILPAGRVLSILFDTEIFFSSILSSITATTALSE